MRFLDARLRAAGLDTWCPRLPTTLGGLVPAVCKLEEELSCVVPARVPVHFVAHSMGGLVTRLLLSRRRIDRLGPCVLIATPSGGTELARIALRVFPPLSLLSPSLRELAPPGPVIAPPLNEPPPKIGVVGGTENSLRFARFLPGNNDGRVSAASLAFEGASETVLLPYNHHAIHHREECAGLVLRFLLSGTFSQARRAP